MTTPAGETTYRELNAELERRLALAQLAAASAQQRSAWYQLLAVIAMFLTAVATVVSPWLTQISN